MSITENFLVNTKNFESIIEELRTAGNLPPKITNKFLEQHGYSNPSDLLVLHLFKDLGMLGDDGSPTQLFSKFRKESSSNKAMAEGIVEAYSDLFKENALVHKLPREELKEEFKKFFGSSKSDLILKYMANTFTTLVEYAGEKNVAQASEEFLSTVSGVEDVIKDVAEKQKNGTSKSHPPADNEVAVADDHSDDTVKKEEKGQAEIEDFFNIPKVEQEEEQQSDASKKEQKASNSFDIVEHIEPETEQPADTGNAESTKTQDNSPSQTEKPADKIEEKRVPPPETDLNVESSISDDDPFGLEDSNLFMDSEETEEPSTPAGDVNAESSPKTDQAPAEPEPPKPAKKEIPKVDLPEMEMPEADTSDDDPNFIDQAFLKKAELLYKLGKYEQALPAFKQVIDRYGDSDDPAFKGPVSRAVILRASILGKMKRFDEALPAYDEVFERFEHSDNPEFYNYASTALIKMIEIMEMLELNSQLIPLYSKAIDRLGDSDDPRFIQHIDKAYTQQVEIMIEQNQPLKALDAINAVIKRFKNSGRANKFLKKAMYMKAELLEQLGHDEEALQAYDSFLSTFGKDS